MLTEQEINDMFDGAKASTSELIETPVTEVIEQKTEDIVTDEQIKAPEKEIVSEEKIEKPHWRERLKTEPDTQEEKRRQDSASIDAKLKEIEENEINIAEWKKVKDTPAYQFFLKEQSEGRNGWDAVKSKKFENISDLTPLQLFNKKLDKYGADFTQEEREAEIRNFSEGKTRLEQIEATNSIKEELVKEEQDFYSSFSPKKEEPKEIKLDPVLKEKADRFVADFNSKLELLDGKEHGRIKFSPKVLDNIEKKVFDLARTKPELFIDKSTGDYSATKAIDLVLFTEYNDDYIGGLKDLFKSDGIEEALKHKHNVGSGNVRTTGMPDKGSPAARKEAEIKSMFPYQD